MTVTLGGQLAAMSRPELATIVTLWVMAAAAMLRWPGRTVGAAVAVVAWTSAGPIPAAAALAVTAGAAWLWHLWGPPGGRGLWDRPPWACWTLSAAATVLAPGWWLLAGLGSLVVSTLWLMATSPFAGAPTPALAWAAARHRRLRRADPQRAKQVEQAAAEHVVDTQAATLVEETEAFLKAATD